MTEEVVTMTSFEQRIGHEAQFYNAESDQVHQQYVVLQSQINHRRDERLREVLAILAQNTLRRMMHADARLTKRTRVSMAASLLKGKHYQHTYHSASEPENLLRVSAQLTALLAWCGNDKKQLTTEIGYAFDAVFPIPGQTFRWNPRIVRLNNGLLTLVFARRRITVVDRGPSDISDG